MGSRPCPRGCSQNFVYYQYTNTGSCFWFEFAREVLRQAGRGSICVLPTTTAQAVRPAKRPAYSVLSPASLYAHGMMLRCWQEATGAYLGACPRIHLKFLLNSLETKRSVCKFVSHGQD